MVFRPVGKIDKDPPALGDGDARRLVVWKFGKILQGGGDAKAPLGQKCDQTGEENEKAFHPFQFDSRRPPDCQEFRDPRVR
jgi:hypothetical protein